MAACNDLSFFFAEAFLAADEIAHIDSPSWDKITEEAKTLNRHASLLSMKEVNLENNLGPQLRDLARLLNGKDLEGVKVSAENIQSILLSEGLLSIIRCVKGES